uniref:Aquaporin n=1 Tax=Ascaris lumbricoides TaxID=6252 RepID=A0A9J2PLG8_ASCLU
MVTLLRSRFCYYEVDGITSYEQLSVVIINSSINELINSTLYYHVSVRPEVDVRKHASALLGFSTVNSQLSTSIYEGAIVFLLMSMLARISGGHFNPAITISVLLCGQCRITLGICIVFMQLFGSFIGAMLVRTLILEAAYIDIFRGSILDESNATLVNRIQLGSIPCQERKVVFESVQASGVWLSFGVNVCDSINETQRNVYAYENKFASYFKQ